MDVMKETAKVTVETVEKTGDAAKKTQKTFVWVIVSAIVGFFAALLADPQVLEVAKQYPKLVIWIPVANVVVVFAKKLFDEYK